MLRYMLPYSLTLLSCLAGCGTLYGQAEGCMGSLGEPIFFEDFGSGPGLGPPLPSGRTNYIYLGPGRERIYPDDGEYAIANNVQCGKADWHSLPDHTPGDENGYTLVVNADEEPNGAFYRPSVSGLCRNTPFEFSAWITNANTLETCDGRSIRPNIRSEEHTSELQ